MANLIRRFVQEDAGQDMIEYALLAAFISIIAWVTVQAIGGDVLTMYGNISAGTTAAAAGS